MKAMACTEYGPPDVLKFKEVERPAVADDEVLVEVHATSINFGFNLVGLPTYPSVYDKFLIVVGLVFNVVTVWYAWKWV